MLCLSSDLDEVTSRYHTYFSSNIPQTYIMSGECRTSLDKQRRALDTGCLDEMSPAPRIGENLVTVRHVSPPESSPFRLSTCRIGYFNTLTGDRTPSSTNGFKLYMPKLCRASDLHSIHPSSLYSLICFDCDSNGLSI